MYVGAACFDPQEDVHGVSSMELQLQQQHLSLNDNNSSHLMQQQALMINQHQNLVDLMTYNEHEHDHDHHESSWGGPLHDHIFDFTHSLHHHHQGFNVANTTTTSSSSFPDHHQTPPELVFNLLPSSVLPNSSTISLADLPADPLFHLNLSPHHHHDDVDACIGRGRHVNGKRKKPVTTERQRREQLNNKFQDLRDLVPNPTKADKASVVGDAIEYIRELLGTVNELKKMVEKKRCDKSRERSRKRPKTEEEDVVGQVPDHQSYSDGSSKSSWLQRKSNDIEVDVRVVDDEVTIKLVQPKKIDCLLFVSKALDDLHLDLHHVAGGQIGGYYSFLFNTKMYEGSCVYAGAVANKLIDVMDCKFEGSGVSSGRRVTNV